MATKKELSKFPVSELVNLVVALENKNAEQKNIIDEMNSQLDKKVSVKNPSVTVDKKEYEILFKSFSHNKVVVTAADVQADTKLAKELVEMGSGALKLIEE